MLKAGVIEPAESEWASPVVLVPKSDGSLRFCVDYRRLNALTVRDSFPLPRMDKYVDSLGDANVFTTLDCDKRIFANPDASTRPRKDDLYVQLGYLPFYSNALWVAQRSRDVPERGVYHPRWGAVATLPRVFR